MNTVAVDSIERRPSDGAWLLLLAPGISVVAVVTPLASVAHSVGYSSAEFATRRAAAPSWAVGGDEMMLWSFAVALLLAVLIVLASWFLLGRRRPMARQRHLPVVDFGLLN